ADEIRRCRYNWLLTGKQCDNMLFLDESHQSLQLLPGFIDERARPGVVSLDGSPYLHGLAMGIDLKSSLAKQFLLLRKLPVCNRQEAFNRNVNSLVVSELGFIVLLANREGRGRGGMSSFEVFDVCVDRVSGQPGGFLEFSL